MSVLVRHVVVLHADSIQILLSDDILGLGDRFADKFAEIHHQLADITQKMNYLGTERDMTQYKIKEMGGKKYIHYHMSYKGYYAVLTCCYTPPSYITFPI